MAIAVACGYSSQATLRPMKWKLEVEHPKPPQGSALNRKRGLAKN